MQKNKTVSKTQKHKDTKRISGKKKNLNYIVWAML